jgi:SAM-dependent methyltransferase
MIDMVKRDRFIAREAYEKMADAYARMVDTKPHNAYLERPATLSLLTDVRGKRVLDAGCGTGRYTEWLVEHGAEVTGFDASPDMLAHAEERVGGRADLRLHDLNEPLDFLEDGSVDLVLATLVLDYIEDWRPVFVEFRRVLRDGGALVFSAGHPTLDYILKEGGGNYFEVERFDMWWTGFGERVLVPSYRRPLQNMTDALREASFTIDRLVEARPTPEYLESDPEGYEKVSRRPSFICIRAKPLG